MIAQAFYSVFKKVLQQPAIIYNNTTTTYLTLAGEILHRRIQLGLHDVLPGDVVALQGDFSLDSIAMLFALIENHNIIVPFNNRQVSGHCRRMDIAGVQHLIVVDDDNDINFSNCIGQVCSPFYKQLRKQQHPGLVLFTSGTSGEPKAAVHDFVKLLEKFKVSRRSLRTLNFLLFDHWGGLNTMFHTLSNAGTVMILRDRDPRSVCEFIEKHKIELLPTSPTFLNMLLMSEEYKNFDLTSLQVISYGTEPMPQITLDRVRTTFPWVKLQQTYGLIELGVLRSQSKEDGSLWVKIGGTGYETRVVDGLLEIKAASAMLGYLNAPSPFTADGWFQTGDRVEQDGEYVKILGRASEIINVGGLKVYPVEVENVILQMDNVAEVTVRGERNVITGNIVCAVVRLLQPEDAQQFGGRLVTFCRMAGLQSFQIPIKITISDKQQYTERFKKQR